MVRNSRPAPLHIAAAVISATLAIACDTLNGVSRGGPAAFMPPPALVDSIVRSVPGVDSATYEMTETNRRRTDTGADIADTMHTFAYRVGPENWVTLNFYVDRRKIEYWQQSRVINLPKPQHEVDAVLPVMREIEVRLESRAGLQGLRDSVKQDCVNVRCS